MAERDPITGAGRDYGSTAAPPAVAFVDSSSELFNMSESIAENINTFNTKLRAIEKTLKQIGGPNDNIQLREKIRGQVSEAAAEASIAAKALQRLAARRPERPLRLQTERLAQAFKDALAHYSTLQKEVSEKMSAHSPKPPRLRPAPDALAVADDDESALLEQQQAQARLEEFETSMLAEREEQVSRLEAEVLDVNQIMRDLAALVHAQAQTVDSVESHIESAGANVEAGVDELAKAAEYQRRYRRKMFILIIIAAIVAIVFIVWIVRAFK